MQQKLSNHELTDLNLKAQAYAPTAKEMKEQLNNKMSEFNNAQSYFVSVKEVDG